MSGHPSCLCPLCDDEIFASDDYEIVIAHGALYIVHQICRKEDPDE